jgi:predicted ester cyclase
MLRGTHEGVTRAGIAPTGKQVAVSCSEFYRLDGGKVIEKWMNFDFLGLMQQMGAIPSTHRMEA